MNLISLKDIKRVFYRGEEEIHALNGVNLEINKADFVAITGSSGSGKSTLLYILGLLDKPSNGSYFLQGEETANLSDDSRARWRNQNIGFIFQSFHLLPRLNALRNVTMPLIYAEHYQGRISENERKKRALECLERVGLKDRSYHLPNQLSGGQRQRVAIARALINNPSVILADEPTGNLDSKTGHDVIELLLELNNAGVTILLVSHDKEISSYAKRQIVMKDGVVHALS
jgi:putative ABC transport system ATP-binding protein